MTGAAPLRVAMVGMGWAAREIWLPRITAHPGYTLAAVVDPDPAARAAAAAPLRVATVAELPAGAVDLAVVAVPNHLHAAVAADLLTAGVPTFVEKPVCLNSAEAARLAAAERCGAPLLAGSAARHRADVRKLIELSDTVGEIRHIALSWVRASGVPTGVGWFTRSGLSGGGSLVDLGWHLLDTVLPLLGDAEFEQVAGSVSDDFIRSGDARADWRRDAGGPVAGDVEDTARGFLVTQDGLSVSLRASWASHQPIDVTTITVEGSTGTARLECTFGFSPNRCAPTLTVTRAGTTTEIPIPAVEVGAEYDRLLDDLVVRLGDQATRGVAIGETRRIVDVIERVYRCALKGSAGDACVDRPARAVVFDLDGVLADSFGVMRQAFTAAYREVVGEGEPPFEEYNRHLGRYFPDIMRIMGLPLEMEEPFVRVSTQLADQVTMFAGVRDLLRVLRDRGIATAVATGKAGWRARSLLDRLGVLPLFDYVLGGDDVPRAKPAPDIVLRALDLLDVDAADAVMVGDAVTDLVAAKAAGVRAIAATWGETDEDALLAAGPDLVLREPADLIALCPPVTEPRADTLAEANGVLTAAIMPARSA